MQRPITDMAGPPKSAAIYTDEDVVSFIKFFIFLSLTNAEGAFFIMNLRKGYMES